MPESTTLAPPRPAAAPPPPPARARVLGWIVVVVVLTALLAKPLYQLFQFAVGSDLYSHIPLIPLVSAGLIWMRRDRLPAFAAGKDPLAAAPLAFVGGLALAAYAIAHGAGMRLPAEDSLALIATGYVTLISAAALYFFGRRWVGALAFPFAFLAFMVPMPLFVTQWIETGLQHSSAAVAFAGLDAVGTPVFRQGLVFQVPGITLEVAPECSGIHSTLALLITSLVAGYLFLSSPWARATLALVVVPIAILRNGVRVFTISQLCVHYGPDMIHSYIHKRGGPIFFALSLIPFAAVLLWLVRRQKRAEARTP